MPFAVLGCLLFLAVLFAPRWWVKRIGTMYSADRPDYPGTGGDLARHLLDACALDYVPVEFTDGADRYDPVKRVVQLARVNYYGRSLTAVAVAAFQVGHAIQHRDTEPAFMKSVDTAASIDKTEKAAKLALFMVPVVGIFTRSPVFALLTAACFVLLRAYRVLYYLTTLPVELDAAFNKALPILSVGYLEPPDQRAARRVLKACAFSRVAAACASLLNPADVLRR
ncbi:MAG: zinc metallopeptidase [Methylobacteriaceae bacterium]|jgi:Zn-dependent membrane protease YugP|nr:zinc metallopeptidase [Methylobacteriaceae bacterium]